MRFRNLIFVLTLFIIGACASKDQNSSNHTSEYKEVIIKDPERGNVFRYVKLARDR